MGKFGGLEVLKSASAVSKIGTGIQIFSAVSQATQARNNAKFNEAAARQEAELVQEQKRISERQIRREEAQQKARLRSRAAKAGVVSTEGTPLLQQLQVVADAEFDVINLRRSADFRSASLLADAAFQKQKAGSALVQGFTNVGSILTKNLKPSDFAKGKVDRNPFKFKGQATKPKKTFGSKDPTKVNKQPTFSSILTEGITLP